MAMALGAIKDFFHIFTGDWAPSEASNGEVLTILDVLPHRCRQS